MAGVIDVLKSHGIDVQETGNPDEWILTCPEPSCGRPKLYLNSEKRLWTCFRCGLAGGVRKLFRLLGIDHKQEFSPTFQSLRAQAEAAIAARTGTAVIESENEGTSALPPEYREITTASLSSVTGRASHEYLLGRGVTDEMIRLWGLGYCESGRYSGFCIIPIRDHTGAVMSFQARRVAGLGQKSLNPGGGDKFLFNIENAVKNPGLVLVEGPFDAMAVHAKLQAVGLPISAVALLGHSCSIEQAAMISRVIRPARVWVALDPDITKADMHKVGSILRMNGVLDVRVALLPRDPDELDCDELADCLDVAEPALLLRKT